MQRLLEHTWPVAQALEPQLCGRHLPARQVWSAVHGVSGHTYGSWQTLPSPHTWVPVQSAVLLHLIFICALVSQPTKRSPAKARVTTWKFRMAQHSSLPAAPGGASSGARGATAGAAGRSLPAR